MQSKLFSFIAKHPELTSIDEILDAFGAPAESRDRLKKAYFEKCGKMIRKALGDQTLRRAIESSQRQQRRLKQKSKRVSRKKAAPKRRAKERLQSSIIPALVVQGDASPQNVQGTVNDVHSAVSESVASSKEPEGLGLGGGIAEEEEEQVAEAGAGEAGAEAEAEEAGAGEAGAEAEGGEAEAEEAGAGEAGAEAQAEEAGAGEAGAEAQAEEAEGEAGSEGQLAAIPLSSLSSVDMSSRVASEGAGGDEDYAISPDQRRELRREKAMAKIRFLVKMNPGIGQEAVVQVARQMKDLGRLLKQSDGVRITWPEVDLILGEGAAGVSGAARGVGTVGALGGSTSSSLPSFGSARVVSGVVPQNRIHLAKDLLLRDFADVVIGMREEDQAEFSERLSSMESKRLPRALDFVKELRGAKVPDHAAALRIVDMDDLGQAELERAGGRQQTQVTNLKGKTCEYNCEAMKRGIEKLLGAQLAATLVVSLVSSRADPNIINIALEKLQSSNTQALAVVDYLNQGMKRARSV
jgi:hypothetical protein